MAGFLDNFRWPECECIDWSERRNAVASVIAGILVSLQGKYYARLASRLFRRQYFTSLLHLNSIKLINVWQLSIFISDFCIFWGYCD